MINVKNYLMIIFTATSGLVFASDAQLLLVRDANPNKTCDVPVFNGKLYSVPNNQSLDDVSSVVGLNMLTRTQELPFEDNASGRSSIPTGTYSANIREDQTKSWMQGKPDRAWRLELINTNPRSAIQFHYGKDKSWSKGCVILTGNTDNVGLICRAGDPDTPDGAVTAVRNYVNGKVNSSSDSIRIRIVEWSVSE
ncbi:MAG: hypothetical protein BVN35_08550 [Proteobacteria bacterium ST_bin11]|nr:MAG: hypothetical protein BVN35_08550 [Proteobacteria bacterium ST_bin11]